MRDPYEESMNSPALETCRCRRCGADIEFDPATFIPSHQTARATIGQKITCPCCGLATELTRARTSPAAHAGPTLLYLAAAALIIFGGGIGILGGLILIALGLILAQLQR